MPELLKRELVRPYGFLFKNNDKLVGFLRSRQGRIITVGDVVSSVLREYGIIPFLSVIDGKTKRNIMMELPIEELIKVKNEKSLIRLSTMKIIEKILNENRKNTILLVDGEEDLLVIPIILFGKDNDVVVYGQPNAGAVVVIINELAKTRVKQIFEKFIVKKC